MVTVNYKNSKRQRVLHPAKTVTVAAAPAAPQNWTIRKKFRLNPLTNSDHAYDPDYYKRHSYGDARMPTGLSEQEYKVRAVQTMLHQQTNYNWLQQQGLYKQSPEVVRGALKPWYQDIARKFPAYREACESEYARHLRKHQRLQDQDL